MAAPADPDMPGSWLRVSFSPRSTVHGLYRALVQTRLAHAHARGSTLATSHAREDTSAPILEKIGFETVWRFLMYFG